MTGRRQTRRTSWSALTVCGRRARHDYTSPRRAGDGAPGPQPTEAARSPATGDWGWPDAAASRSVWEPSTAAGVRGNIIHFFNMSYAQRSMRSHQMEVITLMGNNLENFYHTQAA